MGYGAVVPDGYGASYNPQPNSIIFCLASFHSYPETSTVSFYQSLQRSLDLMRQTLEWSTEINSLVDTEREHGADKNSSYIIRSSLSII